MEKEISQIIEKVKGGLKAAGSVRELNELKVGVLGKSGELTQILRGMKDVAPEDKPKIGTLVNQTKDELENLFREREAELAEAELNAKLSNEKIDITQPSQFGCVGAMHPTYRIMNHLIDACVSMGFEVVLGPEIETDYYNFEALNVPKDHPARDMHDTFYVNSKENLLLRTHTSPVQARVMEKSKPPIKIVCPGRVYRSDYDATHAPMFHQFEGLVIDENLSMVDLKAMLNELLKRIYGEETKIRFRPSYFPFTEPSVEVDVSCAKCGGGGCRLCKGTGFIELLGAGIVNDKVLEASGIDSKKYRGFAFGWGVDRPAMIKYGIGDLRTMFENDKRFLDQLK